jgi:hypothetical protein
MAQKIYRGDQLDVVAKDVVDDVKHGSLLE